LKYTDPTGYRYGPRLNGDGSFAYDNDGMPVVSDMPEYGFGGYAARQGMGPMYGSNGYTANGVNPFVNFSLVQARLDARYSVDKIARLLEDADITTFEGKDAKEIFELMKEGASMNIVEAFNQTLIIMSFGDIGGASVSSNGGIKFENATAGVFEGTATVVGNIGETGGGESDWVGITNSVAGYVSYASGIISNTFTSTKVGSDIAYFLSNSKAFINSVKYLKPITYGATGVGMFSDFYFSTTGQQSWTESGINTGVTIGATIVGGWLGIGLQVQYQASKGYMKTISKHPEWVMPSRYHSFTH
jgi:hypothetical protein